jgi:tetratricopeptide (TPR) repeat protein/predicted AlkP superfamily phosphohydrolase/phosphomutase
MLIGVDGADMGIIDRLIGEGKLPTFTRLKREGAYGRLRSIEPLLSPIVWTTIATGREAQDHGIFDFIEIGADGSPTPITSVRRKVPALWNIAGQYGVSSGFVGWYASYPAERVDGFEVSDRLAFHQVSSARATAGATYPENLEKELYARFGAPAPDLAATKSRFLADPAASLSPDGERRIEELARIRATTEFYRRAAPALERERRTALLGVYFELVDACGHLFMEDGPPKRPDVTDADYAAFHETVDRCYQYQDEVLADFLRLESAGTTTIVVSDHGFKSGDLRPETSGRADTGLAPLWHQLYGVVFVHGGGAAPGREIGSASVLDVAPTVISLLGVPLSRELPGHFLAGAFTGPPRETRPTVAAYAPAPKRSIPAGASSDAEAVRRLAALGYLGGSARVVPHDAEGRTVASYLNEGSARAARGDNRGALVDFGRAIAIDPKNVDALIYAARIYVLEGDPDRAQELQDRALAIKPDDTAVHLQRASWAIDTGHLDMAGAELDAVERKDANLSLLHILRARLLESRSRPMDALPELDRAERLTDSDAFVGEILIERASILASLGKIPEADAELQRASRVLPRERVAEYRGDLAMRRRDPATAAAFYGEAARANDRTALERKLGKALAASGNLPAAEHAFRQALARATTREEKEGAYGDLSVFFQFSGRPSEVIGILEEGTRVLPGSAALWAMLGAAQGRAGATDAALAAYERSVAIRPGPLTCKTLALLLFQRQDRQRAVALWKQSLALDPSQRDVREFLQKYQK